ncbi:hypothetical protein BC833DRAFT_662756 [Globomyces pollinis-pini]|nr:hypothetical protein BC833DRAFT_662756 [Globomyces pollinis-pini]
MFVVYISYEMLHITNTEDIDSSFNTGYPWWIDSYARYEAFQVTMFLIQEVILGALYLYYVKGAFPKDKALVFHTVYIQIVVIILDMIMVGTEYAGFYDYQITTKTLLYCLKVKLEFAVLNMLQETVKTNKAAACVTNLKTNMEPKKPEANTNQQPEISNRATNS